MPKSPTPIDYETLARELVVALRGKRSQAALSRRLGYRSNVVHRWEAGECWPTAAAFLRLCERQGIDLGRALTRFFGLAPAWLGGLPFASPQGAAALLQHLRGKTPLGRSRLQRA